MFDPNDKIDLGPTRVPQRPDRPMPQPIDDPNSRLWVPGNITQVEEKHHITTKQQVKHIGDFLVPIIGIGLVLGVFAYLALILIGVYK